jgi:hypothetical protein
MLEKPWNLTRISDPNNCSVCGNAVGKVQKSKTSTQKSCSVSQDNHALMEPANARMASRIVVSLSFLVVNLFPEYLCWTYGCLDH